MADVFRSIQRLENFDDAFEGLESFSIGMRMQDFVKHYFTRFLSNIKTVSKDFSRSEIDLFNSRWTKQIDLALKDPLANIDRLRVAIPTGMIGSYYDTVQALVLCLAHIHADRLHRDLTTMTSILGGNGMSNTDFPTYSKRDFDIDKVTISKLYSSTGLSYSLGKSALVSLAETRGVNAMLLSLTSVYYPMVMALNRKIDELERTHRDSGVSSNTDASWRKSLMDLAYRVSIFAVVMDHIQSMEHSFTNALLSVRNAAHNNWK